MNRSGEPGRQGRLQRDGVARGDDADSDGVGTGIGQVGQDRRWPCRGGTRKGGAGYGGLVIALVCRAQGKAEVGQIAQRCGIPGGAMGMGENDGVGAQSAMVQHALDPGQGGGAIMHGAGLDGRFQPGRPGEGADGEGG